MTGHILITGANRGLGLEFVRQYAEDGWTIDACCRAPADAPKLQDLAKAHPDTISIHALDVTNHAAVEALAADFEGTAFDVVLNNAGIMSHHQSLNDLDMDDWRRHFEVNTIAPFVVARAFRPCLAAAREPKLVMISTHMGSIESSGGGHYAYGSSKAALNMVMHKLALDLSGDGITCISFHPGWVSTDMGGPSAPVTPERSIAGMRKVISGLSKRDSGRFLTYDGKSLPW